MKLNSRNFSAVAFLAASFTLSMPLANAALPANPVPLAGTWTLVAADVIHPDGSRAHDYGENPKGFLIIDSAGRYSLQIYKSERPVFASQDKGAASDAEFKAAVMGSSTHFGTVSIDKKDQKLTFHITNASFPNWQGNDQVRNYKIDGKELSYSVVARPNGDVPISVWRRLD